MATPQSQDNILDNFIDTCERMEGDVKFSPTEEEGTYVECQDIGDRKLSFSTERMQFASSSFRKEVSDVFLENVERVSGGTMPYPNTKVYLEAENEEGNRVIVVEDGKTKIFIA